MDQALNSQKTPHTSPLRASYGMSFVSILMKNDRVIKGFYCIAKNHHSVYIVTVTGICVGSQGIFFCQPRGNPAPSCYIGATWVNVYQ